MTGTEILGIVCVILLVVVSAVLAAAETSLTHTGRARAETLSNEGVSGAATLSELLRQRDRALNPILLLLLVCHLGSATIVGALVQRRWGSSWIPLAFLVQLLVIFVFAEALPKIWALRSDRVATRLAGPIRALVRIAPLRWVTNALITVSNLFLPSRMRGGPAISEDDLLAFAKKAVEDQAIDSEESELIEAVLELADTIVREIMTPRPDMITLEAAATLHEAADAVIAGGYSRLPVIGDDVDDVVGVVFAKDLLRAERAGRGDESVTTLMRQPVFVPETKRAAEQLRYMQEGKFHLAIVVDEYGGTAGLITLEDIIEEVLGEIVDEYDDEEPLLTELSTGAIRVHGRMPVDELNDLLDAELPDGDWDTVGGLIFNALGRVPDVGESYDLDGYRFRVEVVEGRRITRVRVGKVLT